MKNQLIVQTLPKAVPESMFQLTDFAVRTLRVSGSYLCTVNQVFVSHFIRLLADFQ
jgi:hypothetical protein